MTRFARAKGSKSSNEKTPEQATPWLEMKKIINPKSTVNTSSPSKNAILTDIRGKTENKKTEWASFDNDTCDNFISLLKKQKKRQRENIDSDNKPKSDEKNGLDGKVGKAKVQFPKEEAKTSKKNEKNESVLSKKSEEVEQASLGSNKQNNKKAKKRKKANNLGCEEPFMKKKKGIENDNSSVKEQKFKSISKKNNKEEYETHKFSNNEKKKVRSMNSSQGNMSKTGKKDFNKSFKHNHIISNKKNKSKNKQDAVEELIVNGERIKIVKFQGFNVTLEDADRLKKLKLDMHKAGVPKDKLEAALKLERRRAEKALSRLKKAVCFHCRGHGHLLSQCPSLTESENTGTGICYKCGSTEHSAVECKVVKGASFQYAECFICKEQGHIARQCPDNPRGLYPQGGACRECGDVTHLRKDCPKFVIKKAEETITVGMRGDGDLECLEEEVVEKGKENLSNKIKKKSIVKF